VDYDGAVFEEDFECNLCGAKDVAVFLDKCRDYLHGLPGQFTLVQCRKCGLVYLKPRPSAASIGLFYRSDYLPHQNPVVKQTWRSRVKRAVMALWTLPYIPFLGRPGPLVDPFGARHALDIGCGSGYWTSELQRKGWTVEAIDPSESAVNLAKKQIKEAKFYIGTLETVDLPPAFYDFALMWHSLEHLHNPKAALKRVHDLLRPAGRLKLAVPNICSWEAKLFGRYWHALDAPRHLFLFSPITLRLMLEAAGFRVIRMRPQLFIASVADSVDRWLAKSLHVGKWYFDRRLTSKLLFLPVVLSYLLGNKGCLEVDAVKI
jgi:2-polyprenyl-3-methyl-5-hydroxy-6-metoxy-1,4-benzoquinol methylase